MSEASSAGRTRVARALWSEFGEKGERFGVKLEKVGVSLEWVTRAVKFITLFN